MWHTLIYLLTYIGFVVQQVDRYKVHIFWEGHKSIPLYFDVSKNVGDFSPVVWLSHNIFYEELAKKSH